MKKLVLALASVAAVAGLAFAGDVAPRAYAKAPAPLPPPSWTGFYIFGGAGGGIWDADSSSGITGTSVPLSISQRQGGAGWFGTVGLGYDWQFNGPWVFGLLADGEFGSLRGTTQDPFADWTATIKMQDAWAAGARVGYLVAPNVLSYVNGGYSRSHLAGTTLLNALSGPPVGAHTNSFNRNGAFIGGGVENSLHIFGINATGAVINAAYLAAHYCRP